MSTSSTGSIKVDLSDLRVPYHSEDVKRDFSEKDPLKLFEVWINVARNTDGIKVANEMVLATADLSGKPSVRYVLLKGFGKDGFRFCTNYESRKGKEMAANPNVALLFYWEPLWRQVLLKKRADLETQYAEENSVIPKPDYWGGYRVIPRSFEFWCGRTNRLHDRLRFRLPAPNETLDNKLSFQGENGWIYEYLSP